MGEPASSAPIAAGDLLAGGRYRVEEVLGEGGMGVVCAATHVALSQKVAIKFLLPEALDHPQAVARFEREARASASMTSEHVVRVTDVGTLETGAPYFVMEFLEGEDLAQRLRRQGPLDVRVGLALMAQACEGLIEAHSKGLVHRDIKPSNLFLAKRASGKSVLKVIDFGIAKADLAGDGGDHALTRTSEIMGSPQYMSPEQLRDTKNVDARTDIWSLGAAFYECLTGRPPFTGETITELVVRIATEDAPQPILMRPDLPSEVSAVLERCLTKKLDERFPSASALLEAVEGLRGSTSVRAASLLGSGGAVRAEDTGSFLAFDETSGPISSTRSALAGIVTRSEVQAPKAAASSTSKRMLAIAVVGALGVVAAFAAGRVRSAEVRVEANGEAAKVEASASTASRATPSATPDVPAKVDVPVRPEVASPEPTLAKPDQDLAAAKAPSKATKPSKAGKGAAARASDETPAPVAPTKAFKDDEKKRKYDPGFE